MRKSKILLTCLLLLSSATLLSQNKKVDSLMILLKDTKNAIEKSQIFNGIANEYTSSNPKLALEYATKALQISRKNNEKLSEATAYNVFGNINIVLGDYKKALKNFANAQIIFESELKKANTKEIKDGLARAYGSIGIVFSEQNSYSKALFYQLKALKIYEETQNTNKCARLYNNIGVIYKAQGLNSKALNYFFKGYKIQEKIKDETIGITSTNIGNVYLNQKNSSKALDYFTKAQKQFETYQDPRGLGELYNNIGLYYKDNKNPEKALEYFNRAVSSFQSIEDKFGIADTYYYIGEIYFEQNKLNEALEYNNKSVALSRELEVYEQIQSTEKRLSEIYEKQNNTTESLKHFKLYSIASDSVANIINIRNSVRTEMNFEFDKIKKEQEKRELLYKEQSKRHRMQILFSVLLALFLFGIMFLIYNRMQLKKTLTLQKELAEYEQKALHLQMNPHFVFNCLGSISSFIVQNGTDSAIKYLSKFSKLMRLTLEYSKESLIPIDKEVESLQNYLELEQLRFNQKFEFLIKKSIEIEDDMALPPLLIQPFVENAIIHGLIPKNDKGFIHIYFTIDEENLVCTIEDNGIGFEKSKELKEDLVNVHKSMALDITKKRLEMISKNAKVVIKELKDNKGEIMGTSVVMSLPIQYIE